MPGSDHRFTHTKPFIHFNNLMKQVIFLFYKYGNRGTESANKLPEFVLSTTVWKQAI